MPVERPCQVLSDGDLERLWCSLHRCMEYLTPTGKHYALVREMSLVAADVSIERNARLAQRWEPAADGDSDHFPDEHYQDDRAHQMKRD